MQIDLTDDQLLLRDTTVRFIEAELPLDRTRDLQETKAGYERSWLRKSAEIGWFAMLIPESHGGGSVSGKGLLDAIIIAEELGRFVQPGPFVPMNVVAAAIATGGSESQRTHLLPSIAAGDTVATWAFADSRGNWDSGAGLVVERSRNELVLTGTRGFVQDAASSDWILAIASKDGEPVEVVVEVGAPGVSVSPLACLDLSRRLAEVTFDGVVLQDSALLVDTGLEPLEAHLNHALVLTCADTVGAVDALFNMTIEYSKDRIAFGRPIGSFQALKHVMADQALHVETCKAGAVAAARAVQAGDRMANEVVSMVAAYIGDVANEVAQECLQVHGGIGYTWEHNLHLYLRRIRANSALYGEPSWHRERVCQVYGLGEGDTL